MCTETYVMYDCLVRYLFLIAFTGFLLLFFTKFTLNKLVFMFSKCLHIVKRIRASPKYAIYLFNTYRNKNQKINEFCGTPNLHNYQF